MNASHLPGRRNAAAPEGPVGDDDQPPSPGLTLELIDETDRLTEADRARLQRTLTDAIGLALQDRGGAHDVRVAVVDDARMSELHESHSGISGTTDVLTFDLRDDDAGPLDVDLVVCRDEAERRAAERAHGTVTELTLYGLHGALHCLGYDDHGDESFRAMHAREDEILRELGLGAAFSGGETGGAS